MTTDIKKELTEKLAIELKGLAVDSSKSYGYRAPAVDVIDCVLSLNRNYDAFVVPRIKDFQAKHPHIKSLAQLKELVESKGPAEFTRTELNYNHPERGEIILSVADYLIEQLPRLDGITEMEKLKSWAVSAKPEDCYSLKIKGFKLAGFQYLRMLFGANTSKPDVHIKRFIRGITSLSRLSDRDALTYLEAAAEQAQVSLRHIDNAIWQQGARSY